MSIKNYNEQGFQLVENLFSKEEMNAFRKKIIDTFMVQSRRLNLSNEKTVNFDDVDKKIFERLFSLEKKYKKDLYGLNKIY